MGLVVQIAANLCQDLWCDIGEVIACIGVSKYLHRVLTNQRLWDRLICAEVSTRWHSGIGLEL